MSESGRDDFDYSDYDLSDYYDDGPEEIEEEEWPRDHAIDRAKEELIKFLLEKKDHIFYLKQLQVIFEKKYFHWIIQKAVKELDGFSLRSQATPIPLENQKTITAKFIWHPNTRYFVRTINLKAKVLAQMSDPNVGHSCGHYAQLLFSHGLLQKGFSQVAQDTRSFEGRSWTETNHDLDYIFIRDGVPYGCEIKNRFEYIDHKEKDIKIRMCKELGLKPLFIMRAAPKNYIKEIIDAGGFAMIFQAHIYPVGFGPLVQNIRREFPGMEVAETRAIPETILNRFLKWHERKTR